MSDDILRRPSGNEAGDRFQFDAIGKVSSLGGRVDDNAATIVPTVLQDPMLRTGASGGASSSPITTVAVAAAGEASVGRRGAKGAVVIGSDVAAQTYIRLEGDRVFVGSDVAANVTVLVVS